jgi:hypothetical protein
MDLLESTNFIRCTSYKNDIYINDIITTPGQLNALPPTYYYFLVGVTAAVAVEILNPIPYES